MSNLKNFRFKVPFLLLVALLLISLACGSNAAPERAADVEETRPAQPVQFAVLTAAPTQPAPPVPTDTATLVLEPIFNIGDMVRLGNNVLVVLGWQDVPANDLATPAEGQKFIAVDLLLVNQGTSPTSISTLLQMSLKDGAGQNYRVDLLANTAAQSGNIDGELAPAERLKGQVGFQIPNNVADLQFVFDASAAGAGRAIVNLGVVPVKIEPPAELAGENEPKADEPAKVEPTPTVASAQIEPPTPTAVPVEPEPTKVEPIPAEPIATEPAKADEPGRDDTGDHGPKENEVK